MSESLNLQSLEQDLRQALHGEVCFDNGTRAVYSTDASNYRQIPIGVVFPKNRDDVIRALEICRKHNAPLLSRGGGTSLAGQACNIAVILDFSRHMNRILEIDPVQKTARVEPGVVLSQLNKEAARHGLFFGPDPATQGQCTLGGMIGNNACGIHSLIGGKTADHVESLEVMTYGGLLLRAGAVEKNTLENLLNKDNPAKEIYRKLQDFRGRYAQKIRDQFPKLPRRVSGYNLDALLDENHFHLGQALTGTEGTCVLILEAALKLMVKPHYRKVVILGYADIIAAASDVPRILQYKPCGLEGIDRQFVANMRKKSLHLPTLNQLPGGAGWLIVELGETTPKALEEKTRAFRKEHSLLSSPSIAWFETPEEQEKIWHVRESATGATVAIPGEKNNWPGWEDAAVPVEHLGSYLKDFYALLEKYHYQSVVYGHFGEGCIHSRIDFDLASSEGIRQYRAFIEEAADLVVRYQGSFSGEHGDGQARAELLERMYGPELVNAFREFKEIWDPQHKMNPGKVVQPYKLDENLRLGQDYKPDGSALGEASLHCIGVGKCRRTEGGTMCPSFRATLDERHSTRGRARLLFEMTSGKGLIKNWEDAHVKEALDLCLSCKACKTECPAGVDMAAYKAEFLENYYKHRARPLSFHFLGPLHRWVKIASRLPALFNFFSQTPGLSHLLKKTAGLADDRNLPALAPQNFRSWHRKANRPVTQKPAVLLWADTFTTYFQPGVAQSAWRVLQELGFEVVLPKDGLCCGRTYYETGNLTEAKRQLEKILQALRPAMMAGAPMIGLEPGCLSVFRDELPRLFPGDDVAKVLAKQSFSFAEFLDQYADASLFPFIPGHFLFHGHCHQKSLWGVQAEKNLFQKIGLSCEFLDTGCCGMAGAFGFLKENAEVSKACGESVLAPAVRAREKNTAVITDGFSCRSQIEHLTGVKAKHLAEILDEAFRQRKPSVEEIQDG